jgi:hypothetical protein
MGKIWVSGKLSQNFLSFEGLWFHEGTCKGLNMSLQLSVMQILFTPLCEKNPPLDLKVITNTAKDQGLLVIITFDI